MRLFNSACLSTRVAIFSMVLYFCVISVFQISAFGQMRRQTERELMTTVTPQNCVNNWLELWRRAKAQNHIAQLSLSLLSTRGAFLDIFDNHDELIEFVLQVSLSGLLVSDKVIESERLGPYIPYVIKSVLAIIKEYREAAEADTLAACLASGNRVGCINGAMYRNAPVTFQSIVDKYDKRIDIRPLKCRMPGI